MADEWSQRALILKKSKKSVSKEDNNNKIKLEVGEELELNLPENPSTGYRWEIQEADDQRLHLQKTEFQVEPGKAIGSEGLRSWIFKAMQAGEVTLRVNHWRPWLKEKSLLESFEIYVEIL